LFSAGCSAQPAESARLRSRTLNALNLYRRECWPRRWRRPLACGPLLGRHRSHIPARFTGPSDKSTSAPVPNNCELLGRRLASQGVEDTDLSTTIDRPGAGALPSRALVGVVGGYSVITTSAAWRRSGTVKVSPEP
jgi:hypothetical protein